MDPTSARSSSPRRIRQNNSVAALRTLYTYGRQSRSELARRLGLNRSSAGHIINELAASGLVQDLPLSDLSRDGPARTGRPGILLDLVPEAANFMGVEIGVEHISIVRIDLSAGVKSSKLVEFDGRGSDPDTAVKTAIDMAFGECDEDDLQSCRGIGVSAPAQMDLAGHIKIAPILGWRDTDLTALVLDHVPIDIPVRVENDANAFAFGETYLRPEQRSGVTLFLLLETGVGGAIVFDGNVFRGAYGLAGEVGHLRIGDTDAIELEKLVGREALLDSHRSATGDQKPSFELFLQNVMDREPEAVLIAEKWARHMAYALVQASRLIDPSRIVIGGSVSALYPMVKARVAKHIRTLQAPEFPEPEIVVDDSGWYGSALGAACMLHERFMSLENEQLGGDDLRQPPDMATG